MFKLTPVAYRCIVERVQLQVPAVDTHRPKPLVSVKWFVSPISFNSRSFRALNSPLRTMLKCSKAATFQLFCFIGGSYLSIPIQKRKIGVKHSQLTTEPKRCSDWLSTVCSASKLQYNAVPNCCIFSLSQQLLV